MNVEIYSKDGLIKVIPEFKKWIYHENLLSEGWIYCGSLDVCSFLEHIYTLSDDQKLIEIKTLTLPF